MKNYSLQHSTPAVHPTSSQTHPTCSQTGKLWLPSYSFVHQSNGLLSYSVSKHTKTSLQTPLPTLDLGSCRTYYSMTVLHFVMLVPMSSGRGILRYKHPTKNHTQPKARKLHYGLSKIFQHTSSSLSPQASKVTYDWEIYYVLIDHFESNPRYSLVQCH